MAPLHSTSTHAPAARALRWWSTSALTTLSQRLQVPLRDWCARWELTLEALELSPAQDASQDWPRAWQGWLGHASTGMPWIWAASPDVATNAIDITANRGTSGAPTLTLGRVLFVDAPEGSVARAIAELAAQELGDELSRRFGHAVSVATQHAVAPKVGVWQGAVAVRLTLRAAESATVWLMVDGDSVTALLRDLPRKTAAPLPPVRIPIAAAIAARTTALGVELAPVVVDLGTLQSLRVGDVLTLPQRLEQPLQLRAPGDPRLVCLGYLGARDGHRAIELLPISAAEAPSTFAPGSPASIVPADRPMTDSTSQTAHVLALNELHDIPTGSRSAIGDAVNPLHSIRTRLQVCVGEIELTVGQLMSAKEHEVYVLDRLVDQPVDLLLEGKVVARGQLVAVDDQFAVRLSEIPTPLKV